jgi:hypothetical protein
MPTEQADRMRPTAFIEELIAIYEDELERHEKVLDIAADAKDGKELTSEDRSRWEDARTFTSGEHDPNFPEQPCLNYLERQIQDYQEKIDYYDNILDERGEGREILEEGSDGEPSNEVDNILPILLIPNIPVLRILLLIYSLNRLGWFSIVYNQLWYYFHK